MIENFVLLLWILFFLVGFSLGRVAHVYHAQSGMLQEESETYTQQHLLAWAKEANSQALTVSTKALHCATAATMCEILGLIFWLTDLIFI